MAELLGPAVSYHLDRSKKFNEVNPGIGYKSDGGLLGGVYLNSYGKPSVYGGKHWETNLLGPVNMGLTAGGVTGYPAAPVLPMLIPEISAKTGDIKWALMFQPPIGKTTKGALALQVRKEIK